jgi:predicted AAA+ superfamily ATPase
MTVKLNLTIDEKVVAKTKRYAARRKTSVSKLVQELLSKTVEEQSSKRKNSFLKKYGNTLTGKLSDEQVREIMDEQMMNKYGR